MNKKISLISNLIIAVVIVSVAIVGFIPERSVTISGLSEYQVRFSGEQSSGGVSLMINVYENTEIVEDMVKILIKNDAKATFFVGGCWADDNAETLKLIIDSGFELGNHGYFHKDHKNLSEKGNFNEINNCNQIVYKLTGYKMNLFAPPSGSYGKGTIKASKDLSMETIMWSKDTIDWRDSDKNLIISRATKNVQAGDLILMHPKPHTLTALEDIIIEIKSRNLKLLTVSECCMLNV